MKIRNQQDFLKWFATRKKSYVEAKNVREATWWIICCSNATEALKKSITEKDLDKSLNLILKHWENIDFLKFSTNNQQIIISALESYLKWKAHIKLPSDYWFSFKFDTNSIRAYYDIFSKFIQLDWIIKKWFVDHFSEFKTIKKAFDIMDAFPEIDFNNEIRNEFSRYLKRTDPYNLDAAIMIKEKLINYDLSADILKSSDWIKSYLKSAWKNKDLHRVIEIIKNFWNIVDIKNELEIIFDDLLKKSYWNAKLLFRHLNWYNMSSIIKEVLIYRLKRRKINLAKELITDFGEWIDFSSAIKKSIEWLEIECFLEECRRVKKELSVYIIN